MALAFAGIARGVVPDRIGLWALLLPTAVLSTWLAMVRNLLVEFPPRPIAPAILEVHSYRTAAALGEAVRADARIQGAQPGLLLWTRRTQALTPWLLPDMANELARLDWDTADEPAVCYLAHRPGLARHLQGGRSIALPPEIQLRLRAFDHCEDLSTLADTLCHGVDHSAVWRGQNFGEPPDATAFLDDVLPCVRRR
jgi:hypothetical protein